MPGPNFGEHLSAHNQLTSVDAARQTTTFTYRSTGDLETVVTPPRGSLTQAQRTTTFSYFADNAPIGAGRLQQITGPISGATTAFTYDSKGRIRTVTESDGYSLTTDYDDMDRRTKVTYPDGTYEEMVYANLDLGRVRDRQNRWTHFFYDANRRVIGMRDSLGRITQHEWCSCGTLTKLTDAAGNITKWTHDDNNRPVKETRADDSETLLVYDATGRVKRRTDALGQHTDYTYFKDDTLQHVSYPNPIHTTADVGFTYDSAYSRVATMSDGIGTTTYAYYPVTSQGTLGATQLFTVDGALANDTVTYAYDELGRAVTRTVNSVVASQTYDALGRVSSVTNALGTFYYTYVNQTSQISSATYPNGLVTTYSYYGNAEDRRLQQLHHQMNTATISKFDYTYDTVGNVTMWSQQRESGASAVARTYEFGYDSAAQLISATYRTNDSVPAILRRYVYTYDATGNRTREQIDGEVRQASYNNLNQLTSLGPGGALLFSGTLNEPATVTMQGLSASVAADNTFGGKATVQPGTTNVAIVARDYAGNQRTSTYAVTQSGAVTAFSYDANGNTTTRGLTATYSWDAENRLVRIQEGARVTTFTYDGEGKRVRIVEEENGSTTLDHYFLWCGAELCEERDGSGVVTAAFFAQGERVSGVDRYYTRDHLTSVREVVDSSGQVIARYDYDPFGRKTVLSGTFDAAFAFSGHYEHDNSKLMLPLFRNYDSDTGRWLSQDPIGLSGGLNLYQYVFANPVGLLDPNGMAAINTDVQRHVVDVNGFNSGCGTYGFSGRGCTRKLGRLKCECQPFCGKYAPVISGDIKIHVYARNDVPSISSSLILKEEEKHVTEILLLVKAMKKQAEELEKTMFSSKSMCDLSCWSFTFRWINVFQMEERLTHWKSPHPY